MLTTSVSGGGLFRPRLARARASAAPDGRWRGPQPPSMGSGAGLSCPRRPPGLGPQARPPGTRGQLDAGERCRPRLPAGQFDPSRRGGGGGRKGSIGASTIAGGAGSGFCGAGLSRPRWARAQASAALDGCWHGLGCWTGADAGLGRPLRARAQASFALDGRGRGRRASAALDDRQDSGQGRRDALAGFGTLGHSWAQGQADVGRERVVGARLWLESCCCFCDKPRSDYFT
jgi:hypothetical protein